jgi:hypothetical protein
VANTGTVTINDLTIANATAQGGSGSGGGTIELNGIAPSGFSPGFVV